jgi:hypothetical protein
MLAFRQSVIDKPLFLNPKNQASCGLICPFSICQNDQTTSGRDPLFTTYSTGLLEVTVSSKMLLFLFLYHS